MTLDSLRTKYPCRDAQITQLGLLLVELNPSPSTIVIHGLEATGKTAVTSDLLASSDVPYAIVDSRETVTGRHLFERVIVECIHALGVELPSKGGSTSIRCESLSTLAARLQKLLESCPKFVLVLDNIDRQMEAPPTLLPALARFGDLIPSLTIVMIVTNPSPRFLHTVGTPHVHFSSYTRDQALQIVTRDPPGLSATSPNIQQITDEDRLWLWQHHCTAVWDTLGKGAAKSIVSLRRVAEKLWEPLVSSVQDGSYGPREFSKIVVAMKNLYQDDSVLLERVVKHDMAEASDAPVEVHELPYYTKYILCAAYLASYNPIRLDSVFFIQSSERKRKKKVGRATPGRPPKHGKVSRRLLGASGFTLERLLAILHAILPHPLASSADILSQVSTLTSLRLLLRQMGLGTTSTLDHANKWKVNVGWSYIVSVARAVDFDIAEWMAEQ